ncbi:FK506-binding protein 59 [Pseudolycoriella hygida]|uniref:peptidylprolyl isomerase n=1 Tax=Pseudolycoriella hygida TaxID=35572 RepID=A0A9Q0NCD9_9DIPT|nr:FK506-binding protein 59 [Pseudolycoriella hygida]
MPEQNVPIDLSGDGGVLKEIMQEGHGDEKPHDGCTVSLHYTGTLVDGTVFDSSVQRNEPFEFELGKGRVIKGFEMFVPTMRKGEKSVLTCAPEYGYGPAGSPPKIPANSTLRFELELLGWKPEDLSPTSDGGIIRHVITPTTKKGKTPNEGGLVDVHLVGKFEDRIFDERDVSFVIGEVSDDEVINGVQTALQKFGKDETSRLVIKPEYAFGASGHKEWNIPPNATVEYTVTLKSFEKEVRAWKLNEEESIEQAKIYKEKGTKFLKDEKYSLAIKMYEKSNTFLSNCSNDESKTLKVAVFLNIALCYSKLDDNFEIKKACNTVLEIDSKNVKALYRRGTSCLKSGDTETALADFHKVLEIEPQNKAAQNQVVICKRVVKESHDKEKKLYANMFTKFANVDKEREIKDRNRDDVLTSCGEWNMEDEARNEASKAFEEIYAAEV